jgi:uncharacterized membrane protein YdjX (TVP38/TMEM64 family)
MRRRVREHARLIILVVGLTAVFVVLRATGAQPSSNEIQSWARGLGALGPVVYLAIGVALSCAFVPFPLLAGGAGALFGVPIGSAVALGVAVAAAVAQMTIARRLAAPHPEALGARAQAVNEVLERRGMLAVFYTRLVPGLPYVPLNYAAGLTSLRVRDLAAGTALATAPRAFAYAALGGTLGNLHRPEALIAIGVLAVMAVVGIVLGRRQVRDLR